MEENPGSGWQLEPYQQGEIAPPVRYRRRRVGSVARLPSGKWRVRVRGFCADGRAIKLDRIAEDEGQVELLLAELRREASLLKCGLKRSVEPITLKEYVARYRKKFPWQREKNTVFKFLRPFHNTLLSAISADSVSSWAQRVTYDGPGTPPRGKGHAGYVVHAYELLHKLLAQAFEDSSNPSSRPLLLSMPFSRKPPGVPKSKTRQNRKRKPYSDEQREALLTAAAQVSPVAFLRLQVLFQTGLRPVELCRARRDSLMDAHRVFASAPIGSGALECPECKGGNAHIVPLPAELYRALLEHWQALPQAARESGLLFPVLNRRRWRERKNLFRPEQWKKICELAGIERVSRISGVPYQARHTRLSWISNETSAGLRGAAALAGHKDQRTTEQYCPLPAVKNLDPAIFQTICLAKAETVPRQSVPREVTESDKPPKKTPITHPPKDREPTPPKGGKKKAKKPQKTTVISGHAQPSHAVAPRPVDRVACDPRVPAVGAQPEIVIGLGRILTALRLHGPETVARTMVENLGAMDSYRHAKEIREALPASGMPPEAFESFLVLLEKMSAEVGLVSPDAGIETNPSNNARLGAENAG